MKELVIVGGSGFGKEVIWLAEETKQFQVVGILDDKAPKGSKIFGKEVIGGVDDAVNFKNYHFVIAIGNPRVRKLVHDRLKSSDVVLFPNLIHPSVIYSSSIQMGMGNIICAGTILTTDIHIGNQNIINLNCTIGHDTVIKDYCTIAPIVAISGNVRLENLVEVGTGSSIRQGLIIDEGGVLGMGGVLTKDIGENQIFIGNPAKFFRSL